MLFQDLQLTEPVLKALREEGYSTPTPVQLQAIPVILQKRDIMGCAQTGTGKTAAFAIPVLELLTAGNNRFAGHKRPVRALVLTPTRELAIQVEESFRAYGRYLPLRHQVIFGGVSQHAQVKGLQAGADILVATPGRLMDLMNQGLISLAHIEYFVLDEADRMLDMGFIHDVKRIITRLPQQRQNLFFSATMAPEIRSLADSILRNPVTVTAAPPATTASKVEQSVFFVEKQDKKDLLVNLLQDDSVTSALVFTRTKHGADKVAKWLQKSGIQSGAIHGNKSQNARQSTLLNFKSGKIRVLVATDIAARGIDIDDVSHVFNFELPEVPDTYVHRIGRTGRAGRSGTAIAFCDTEERALLRDIEKITRKQIPVVTGHAFESTALPIATSRPAQPQQPVKRQDRFRNQKGNRYTRKIA